MAADSTSTLPTAPPTSPPTTPPHERQAPDVAGALPSRRSGRTGRVRRALGLVALVAAAGGTGGVVGASVADDGNDGDTASSSVTPLVSPASRTMGGGLDVAAVLEAVEGAVADIQATGPRQAGQGTGIVYSADGLVLTNAHVVEGATSVTVTTTGDRQPRPATIVGTDPDNDVAVLRVERTDGLVVAQLGRSRRHPRSARTSSPSATPSGCAATRA